ncbi:NitT/TauT family transport system permease protein [Actinocorallia herbida]|uniref:NitT/TauT family transport system permease protein n=1 Tax=Actinocorallia herbida TaxID=58109 RepID=A0A3N1CZH1_9ACTN|nr:NitT/TauT family transport system permease protein [Actinocorallia herbida]
MSAPSPDPEPDHMKGGAVTTIDTPAAAAAAIPKAAAPSVKKPGRLTGTVKNVLPPVGVFLAAIGIWYLISYVLLSERRRFLLPPPHEVVRVGMLDWANLGEILEGLRMTTIVALSGFALAIGIGTVFAVMMSQAKWVERSFYPYAVILQTLPILALTPLVGLWFGYGTSSRIIICTILGLFPIITSTLFGLKSVEPSQRDLFTLMKADRLERFWRLSLPSALPSILTGLRTSGGLAVIGAIVADFFFRQGEPGIGRLLDVYRTNLETERLYTALLFSSLLGLALFVLNTVITHRVLRNWHASARD